MSPILAPLKSLLRLRTGHKWLDMLLLLVLLCIHFKGAAIGTLLQWLLSALLSQRVILRTSPLYAHISKQIQAQKPAALLIAEGVSFQPACHAGQVRQGAYRIAFLIRPEYIWLACVCSAPLCGFTSPTPPPPVYKHHELHS